MKFDGELYHEGIKGQKWGVRNGPPYPLDKEGKEKFNKHLQEMKSEVEKEVSRNKSRKSSEAKAQKNKKLYEEAHTYTDAELREIVNRMRLEEDYKNAVTNRSSQISSGRKSAMDILQTVGTVLAVATSAAGLIKTFADSAERKSKAADEKALRETFIGEARGMTDEDLTRANKRASAENAYVNWKMGKGGKNN